MTVREMFYMILSMSLLKTVNLKIYIDSDAFEFYIVSLDNKQWHFEAASSEERDDWVAVIEKEIFKSLQGNESSKTKPQSSSELASMQSIRSRIPGNGFCVDCDAPGKILIMKILIGLLKCYLYSP